MNAARRSGAPAIVVADASPLHYLILVGAREVIPAIYGRLLIPASVARELRHPNAPPPVREFMEQMPEWVVVATPQSSADRTPLHLGEGERGAIVVAIESRADLVLMDDREGVEEARRRGLTVVGTLGVLVRASERNLVDLPEVIRRLSETNFRASPNLIRQILEQKI